MRRDDEDTRPLCSTKHTNESNGLQSRETRDRPRHQKGGTVLLTRVHLACLGVYANECPPCIQSEPLCLTIVKLLMRSIIISCELVRMLASWVVKPQSRPL